MSSNTSAAPVEIKTEARDNDIEMDLYPSVDSSSSLSSPARTITPVSIKSSPKSTGSKHHRESSKQFKDLYSGFRPRSSIPPGLSQKQLAQECIHAAHSSRLNPFALHPEEFQLLQTHICALHVTAYLNIRNRILRLWVRSPLVAITFEEAAGCCMTSRWFGVAYLAHQWLVRKGYINFGCVEVPEAEITRDKRFKPKNIKRKTIVVIGAGMAGLGCARQLEGLFKQYRNSWNSPGEEPPQVVILESRSRIGGRIYSHPFQNQTSTLPEHARSTAEMGAHIIVGFDHGNPLNMIIRGQLALPYHALKNHSALFDLDGSEVDKAQDLLCEKLYNDILDRTSVYRQKPAALKTFDGDKHLIEMGRDPVGDDGPLLCEIEDPFPQEDTGRRDSEGLEAVPGGVDKFTGKAHMVTGSRKKIPPATAAESMGWVLPSNVARPSDLNLDFAAKSSDHPTLGATMDEAVKQYQFLLDLAPQDLRLLNWHYANLEYANAANLGKLSLSGWDQDIGNEFEGKHAQVIGGYQQLPRGVWQYPSKLDVRTRKVVQSITYDGSEAGEGIAQVLCHDGETFEADHVVVTTPLGVLKGKSLAFTPELPNWKLGPIERLGFGLLNKVILAYEKPFWDVEQDMFGLLRAAEVPESLDQEDYAANRGRFYFFWNCIKTSGRPVLISLMAGDAAYQAESSSDTELVAEVTSELAKMFPLESIPQPLETIVTRWASDPFARGTYSHVGPTAQTGDYEAMAHPVGSLHFAGEHTCGTHPATVHGAYISGLRAASEIMDALIGPIKVSKPLVPPPGPADHVVQESVKRRKSEAPVKSEAPPTIEQSASDTQTKAQKQARLEAVEAEILQAIFDELGWRPCKPGKPGSNPFLLFTKDTWPDCKRVCDANVQRATGNPNAKALRDDIRAAVGLRWRQASEDIKRPYMERCEENRLYNSQHLATFDERLAEWDAKAMEIRRKYVREHPDRLSSAEEVNMWQALGVVEGERRVRKTGGYAELSDSDDGR